MKRGTKLRTYTKLKKKNEARRKRLYEFQFGQKGADMESLPCWVTGTPPSEYAEVDNAHVGSPNPDERRRTRGAGANNKYLARLRRDVHRSFDEDTDDVFERLWQTSKQWVREKAEEFDAWYRTQTAAVE